MLFRVPRTPTFRVSKVKGLCGKCTPFIKHTLLRDEITYPSVWPNQVRFRYGPFTSYRFLQTLPLPATPSESSLTCDSDCLPPGRGDACLTQAGFARHAGQTKNPSWLHGAKRDFQNRKQPPGQTGEGQNQMIGFIALM
jgi:hypothetical protein